MNTINQKMREQIVVWATIVALFTIIIAFTLNFDSIRESLSKATPESTNVAPFNYQLSFQRQVSLLS
jgi:hypothetical protein